MKIHLRSLPPTEVDSELVIVPVAPKEGSARSKSKNSANITRSPFDLVAPETREALEQLDKESNGALKRRLKHLEFRPTGSERLDVSLIRDGKLLIVRLVGISREALLLRENGIEQWRKLGGDAARSAIRLHYPNISISLRSVSKPLLSQTVQAVCEGLQLATYEFRRYKNETAKNEPAKNKTAKQKAVSANDRTNPKQVTLLLRENGSKELLQLIKQTEYTASAINFARDLVNTPAADMQPKDIVAAAREVKKEVRRSKLKVFGQKELKKLKAELILAVAKGSDSLPYLVHLTLPPKAKVSKRVVLIGKGVTYDTGGLCLKPGPSMPEMKCDMAGAAIVLAAFQAASQLSLKGIELHAIIPTVENSIGPGSMRPGDIVRSMNGKTVEILNTDAEGRLIIADALTYSERLKPDLIIDLATLTGACVVALGADYAGIFTKDRELRDLLLDTAQKSGELLWPLPMPDEYKAQLRGQIGDLRNMGASREGGASLAALFLQEFAPAGAKWAHIDMAGPAFLSHGGDYWTAGATGYGIRTLLELLKKLSK